MKNTLNAINKAIISDSKAFVELCENEYISEVYDAAQIIADNDDIKVVALAGPSASGKTTSAHILADRLTSLGETAIIVSLDDFYLSKDKLPLLPNGKADIESVNALDTALIKKCLNEIIECGKTVLPQYDFKTSTSKIDGVGVNVGKNGIVIVEGLHALNPIITELVPRKNIYKIYVSVNCEITDSDGKRILSSRRIRLMRRALRDEIFRGCDINYTLSLWKDVVAAENKYLYCFKHTADKTLKTLHRYEPALYKRRFIEMKNELKGDDEWHEYFLKVAKGVERFEELPYDIVPESSLIREFIGDGKYNRQ